MANKIRNTAKPQNVLAKENLINRKITEEILPVLPSFVTDYDRYLDTQGRSVKTRLAYVKDISYFFDYMISGSGLSEAATVKEISLKDIENLKGRDVNDYLSFIKQYQTDNGTIIENGIDARARQKSSIVGLLKYLYREDMIEYDVTGKIMPINLKSSSRAVKALEENEVMELLDVVSEGKGLTKKQQQYWELTKYRDKLIIALFSIAGLRLSELQQLNISSFNIKRENFIVYRKRGKESIMPMNKTLIDIFNEYMEQDRSHAVDIAAGHEDALFLCTHTEDADNNGKVSYGRKRLSERQISTLVHKYTAIVIGGDGYSPHKLRATAATTAIHRGSDMSKVASLLDHDSVTTTQRYIKITEEDKRDVMKTMNMDPKNQKNQKNQKS